ncbi:ABC transporter ATP-binding protein [Parasedimentitalea huanghaiensis]|uniref:ATP-binding cassette domain-containing protein n=1 Tax=Parasedimentitalea huanghaiensis TaxID=2682100 RepID=A0A6L6WL49_9RHOB|nr:ABC transporter ATP-binding protein [Zongyanglinia huanghaiensis]MVO18563.1 ATP-binding cassette domain-containing protein [Zongyanglinia huanghaiensis]
MAPLLSAQGLQVRYGAVEAVRGVSFEIQQGEIVALLGANGAGKSSILKAIVGLVPTASGQVMFDGRDITGAAPEGLAPAGLTLSPEGRRVFGTLSVSDNLRMGAFGLTDKDEIAEAWERVYDLFPILKERKDQYAGTLSGGQQQMLAVGRALMSNPRLLLLDEPSLGLAPLVMDQIFELIAKLRDQGVTLLVVEQNVAKTLQVADRGYILVSGKIVEAGNTSELTQSSSMQDAYLGAN